MMRTVKCASRRNYKRVNATWKEYIQITKPRIVMSNLVAAFGGFWVASRWNVDWGLLVAVLAGSALVMAASCTFNNYWDREFDARMDRTRGRALPSGRIPPTHALLYAIVLGIAGEAILFAIHPITGLLGLLGIFVYAVVYTMWLKRTSTWSTSVGGVSGSMPPVIGYAAVTGEIDLGAWLLFAILFLWQPPHFWALGIMRREEYLKAGFPLLPVVKGARRANIQMIPYLALLVAANVWFYASGYVGLVYLIVVGGMSAVWLLYCAAGLLLKDDRDRRWAKNMFKFSVHYLTLTFVVMVIGTLSTPV